MAEAAVLVSLIFGIIGFLIAVFITRWVFAIERMVNAAEASMALQAQMARKAGVPEEDIKVILNWTHGAGRSKKIKTIAG